MIVNCKKILDLNGSEMESSTFLTKGKSYPVLSVSMFPGKTMAFRIIADDGTPIVVEGNCLDIEDATVPETWISTVKDGNYVKSGYPAVIDAEIMERYFDGDDPEALEAVKNAVRQASFDTGIDILSISSYSASIG